MSDVEIESSADDDFIRTAMGLTVLAGEGHADEAIELMRNAAANVGNLGDELATELFGYVNGYAWAFLELTGDRAMVDVATRADPTMDDRRDALKAFYTYIANRASRLFNEGKSN